MRLLVLIRHAKSSWDNARLSDFARPLNKRGEHDAPLMGAKLKERNISADAIVCSPAARTQNTMRLITKIIGFKKPVTFVDELYLAGQQDFLHTIAECAESVQSLFLCSHNPGITHFTNFLTGGRLENIPTCGIAAISLLKADWQDLSPGCGKLLFFIFPRQFY